MRALNIPLRPSPVVLVVEDEALIAMDLESSLIALGFDVVGPVMSVKEALERIGSHRLDAAILDIKLRGEMVFPVADALVALGVPFVIVTGQSLAVLPDHLRDRPTMLKPYSKTELMSVLENLTECLRQFELREILVRPRSRKLRARCPSWRRALLRLEADFDYGSIVGHDAAQGRQ